MSDYTHTQALPVDEAWIHDWVDEGIAAIELFLAKHAAFAEYLRSKAVESSHGDGAASV